MVWARPLAFQSMTPPIAALFTVNYSLLTASVLTRYNT